MVAFFVGHLNFMNRPLGTWHQFISMFPMRLLRILHHEKRCLLKLCAAQGFIRVPAILGNKIIPTPCGVSFGIVPGEIHHRIGFDLILFPAVFTVFIQFERCSGNAAIRETGTGNLAIFRREGIKFITWGKFIG